MFQNHSVLVHSADLFCVGDGLRTQANSNVLQGWDKCAGVMHIQRNKVPNFGCGPKFNKFIL